MSNITLNIVEPGSGPTPDPVVPNTGLFTSSIGGPEITTISISTVLMLTMVAIIITAFLYRKQKKSGKVTKLVHLVDSTKAVLKSKKRITAGLTAIALLASAGTLTTLLASTNKNNTNAVEEDGLTLDVTGGDITIEVADEPVFAVAEVKATVKEATEAGYTLTAYTDNTNLVSTTNPDNIIPMVTLPEGSIETLEPSEATETAGELSPLTDNTYGLALGEKPTTKDAEVYMPLSIDSEEPTILKATDYEHTEANDTTTIYYGFYITPDVPYGTYTGTNINYNVEPHYITNLSFNGNGNDGGVDMEGMTIIAGDTITLPENTYTKEGYNFIGWNTAAEGTGKAYADKAEFTASLDKSEDVILYAQWALPVIGDLTEMQDFAKLSEAGKASVLASMTPGQQYQLQDNRDQTMYYIAKLADGNIWMTQNLDLDLNNQTKLTPENTNIKANWTPDNSTIDISDGSFPGWENSNNVPYSADPGDVYYYTSGTNSKDTQYNSLAECEEARHTDCAHYHAGNYYNWSAAVASNDTSSLSTQYANAPGSICPAGWRLPTGTDSDDTAASREWNAVLYAEGVASSPTGNGYTSDGFNKIRTAPLWLARSGYVYYGSLRSTGIYGLYWSSTALNSNLAYYLSFDSGNLYPAFNNGRDFGYSVRCVAQ